MRLLFALLLVAVAVPPAGGAWPRHAIDDTSRGADGVRLADVNGDGRLDVATGWEEGGVVRLYLHPGGNAVRAPWPRVTVGNVASPEDAVLVDLDGDGALDLVSSCEGKTRGLFVHWAPRSADRLLEADAWRTTRIGACDGVQWMFALPWPAEAAGRHDLIVGAKGAGATIARIEVGGGPRDDDTRNVDAWKPSPLRECGWIMSLRSRDMDGDGDLDVLASDRKGPRRGVFWMENRGDDAAPASWPEHAIANPGEAMFLATGDVDGDGDQDVVTAVKGVGLAISLRDGAAGRKWRTTTRPLPAGCGTAKGVAAGDVDGDGVSDLVFSCENAVGRKSGVRWISRGADGSWSDREISGPEGVKFDRLELIDLDADGDLDVLTCEERAGLGVIWYENPRVAPTR